VSPHCFTTYFPGATRDLPSGVADTGFATRWTLVFVPFSLLLEDHEVLRPSRSKHYTGCRHRSGALPCTARQSKAGQGAPRVQGFRQVQHQHIEASFNPSPCSLTPAYTVDRPRRLREHPSRTSPCLSHDVVFKTSSCQYLDDDNSPSPRI
jgi:hypothetical protein